MKNRMRNAFVKKIVFLVLVCMICFSGCSLAVEDAGEEKTKQQDRLIGAFITTDYLDLFDMEAYLNDHVEELISADGSDEMVIDGGEYNQRLYASIDKQNSVSPADWEISFGEVDGICFFDATFQNEGEETFTMIVGGDEICDVASHLSVAGEVESVVLTGTLYALEKGSEIQFYVNPVYQTAEGEIYTVTGNGYHMSGELGGSTKVNIEEETTATENGMTQTYGGAVEITFEVMQYEPVEITLQYMDKDLDIIQTDEYPAGEMLEQLIVPEDTTCVIVETQWEDGSVTRELFEPEEDERVSIETFYKTSNVALGKKFTEIVWE